MACGYLLERMGEIVCEITSWKISVSVTLDAADKVIIGDTGYWIVEYKLSIT